MPVLSLFRGSSIKLTYMNKVQIKTRDWCFIFHSSRLYWLQTTRSRLDTAWPPWPVPDRCQHWPVIANSHSVWGRAHLSGPARVCTKREGWTLKVYFFHDICCWWLIIIYSQKVYKCNQLLMLVQILCILISHVRFKCSE